MILVLTRFLSSVKSKNVLSICLQFPFVGRGGWSCCTFAFSILKFYCRTAEEEMLLWPPWSRFLFFQQNTQHRFTLKNKKHWKINKRIDRCWCWPDNSIFLMCWIVKKSSYSTAFEIWTEGGVVGWWGVLQNNEEYKETCRACAAGGSRWTWMDSWVFGQMRLLSR